MAFLCLRGCLNECFFNNPCPVAIYLNWCFSKVLKVFFCKSDIIKNYKQFYYLSENFTFLLFGMTHLLFMKPKVVY